MLKFIYNSLFNFNDFNFNFRGTYEKILLFFASYDIKCNNHGTINQIIAREKDKYKFR